MFVAGIFCGLAVALRIHLAPAVAVAALYFSLPNWRKRIPPLAAGLLLPVLGFGLVDAFTWANPFQSFLVYYHVHAREFTVPSLPTAAVSEGAAQLQPWAWYLRMLCVHLGPLAILILVGIRRSPLLAWVSLAHLAFHSFYGASQIRYVYPIMPLAVTLAALGFVDLVPAFNNRRKAPLSSKKIVACGLVFAGVTSWLLASQFYWPRRSGTLTAFDQLSVDPTLCGVGVYRIGWWDLGGYAHLHQNVPIVLLKETKELQDQWGSFNALLIHGTLTDASHTFALTGCWSGVCLYHRPGSCTPPQNEDEINSVLRREGR